MTSTKNTKVPPPQPTEPAAPVPFSEVAAIDQHHGHGGMYTVVDGQRLLVERTEPEHTAPTAAATQPSNAVKPAKSE